MPAVMAATTAAGGTVGYLRQQGYPLSNGAGGMLGLAEGVHGHPYSPAAVIAQGPMTLADTDDLLRDPDDVPSQQQHHAPLKQEPEAAGDGVLGGCDQEMQGMQGMQQHGEEAVRQEAAAGQQYRQAHTKVPASASM